MQSSHTMKMGRFWVCLQLFLLFSVLNLVSHVHSAVARQSDGQTVASPLKDKENQNNLAEVILEPQEKTAFISRNFKFDSTPRTISTVVAIFIGSILASAAGIGGGGVFVALLLFIGHFDVWDAVPLSKAMIFTGSLISGYLNLRQVHPKTGGPIVNFDIVRIIVPSALLGTFVGVFLNGILNQIFIVFLLFVILSTVTIRTFYSGFEARRQEKGKKSEKQLSFCDSFDGSLLEETTVYLLTEDKGLAESPVISSLRFATQSQQNHISDGIPSTQKGAAFGSSPGQAQYSYITSGKKIATPKTAAGDISILIALLVLTISAGVLVHIFQQNSVLSKLNIVVMISVSAILFAVTVFVQLIFLFRVRKLRHPSDDWDSCCKTDNKDKQHTDESIVNTRSPTRRTCTSKSSENFEPFINGTSSPTSDFTPLDCNKHHYQTLRDAPLCEKTELRYTRLYPLISFGAGILSGLLGIGGGLIFSPYMVALKVDPIVAVATAATCVIFTSSSTTFQYLLMGRVLLLDALLYGFITTIASFIGVKLVHFVSYKYDKRSLLIFIVAVAVGVSSCLTIAKVIMIAYEAVHPNAHTST